MNYEEIKNKIKEIIEKTTFKVEEISVICEESPSTGASHNPAGRLWCLVRSNESRFLIGRNGETLAALNHLIRRALERDYPENEQILGLILDVNDYQKKKIENLKALAHMLSERAIFFKSSIEADPMSSYDRWIIHEFLSEKPNIKTESTGEGRDRRVVIKYADE